MNQSIGREMHSRSDDGWTRVCASSELGASPKPVWVGADQLVLWRTSAGALVALDDSCPHQGNLLSAGAVIGNRIRCPAHGWEIDADGWCDLAGAAVASHPVREQDGGIFVRSARRR